VDERISNFPGKSLNCAHLPLGRKISSGVLSLQGVFYTFKLTGGLLCTFFHSASRENLYIPISEA